MAAGDLITDVPGVYYQWEYGGILLGDTTDWKIQSLRGVGSVKNSGDRAKRDFADGSSAGYDTKEPGLIVASFQCAYTTPDAAEQDLAAIETAYDATGDVDGELHLLVPYRGHIYYTGRPIEVDPTRVFMAPTAGVIQVQLTFDATDPVAKTPAGS